MKSKQLDIIESAMRMFNQEGFQSPSIDRLSEAANVSKMTFYRYFTDKESLIKFILQQKHSAFINELTQVISCHNTIREKLFSIFHYYNDWFSRPEFNGCMFARAVVEYGAAAPELTAVNMQFKSDLCAIIRDILRECLKPEPAERVAFMMMMLIDGAIAASQTGGMACQEHPPALIAWSAAKTLVYSEGGVL